MSGTSPNTHRRTAIEAAQLAEALRSEISELSQQTRLLRMAIDEYHTDFVWVMRNLPEWMAAALPAETVTRFRTAVPEVEGDRSARGSRELPMNSVSQPSPAMAASPLAARDGTLGLDERAAVIEAYVEYLADFEEAAEPPDEEMRRILAARRLFLPDLVSGGSPDQLIAVRPELTAQERGDMQRWIEVLGGDWEAVRVWPDQAGEQWTWRIETVASSDFADAIAEQEENECHEADSQLVKPALEPWPSTGDKQPAAPPPSASAAGAGSQPTGRSARNRTTAKARRKSQSLLTRIYGQPPLTEVVRLFGHRELPMTEAETEIERLAQIFDADRVPRAAAAELTELVPGKNVRRLTAEARQAAHCLIGRPPSD